ncbi:TonB-dependent receptor plug domain-containing protein [bacterium]|nr:TonB-dependent receptor plug domain-containing protein [bacterium]
MDRFFGLTKACLLYCLFNPALASSTVLPQEMGLYQLSLTELLDVRVVATHTETTSRAIPNAITTITTDQIRRSGARSLDEVLDVYVPGFMVMNKLQTSMVGLRGINSDRNNKMMVLVNGKVVNIHARDGGFVVERLISALGDIRKITVLRGPGAAVYGPGAIAGVVLIETHNASSFEGTELTARGGTGEDFVNVEAMWGKRLDDESGLFFYYGIDDYKGADQSNSDLIFSDSFDATGSDTRVIGGQPAPMKITNDHGSMNDRLRRKFHGEYNQGNFSYWLRYLDAGQKGVSTTTNYLNGTPAELVGSGYSYQQWTTMAQYQQTVNQYLNLEYRFGFDSSSVSIEAITDKPNTHWREDEWSGRIMGLLNSGDGHQLAVGSEYFWEEFGLDSNIRSIGPSQLRLVDKPDGTSWITRMYSVITEYQWEVSPQVITFADIRLDNHTYTDDMISGRLAGVYMPTDKNTYKLSFNRSERRQDDVDLYNTHNQGGAVDSEAIDNIELRYERQHSMALWAAFSAYYDDYDISGWVADSGAIESLGTLKLYGLELELRYEVEGNQFLFSHSYSKLDEFSLANDFVTNNVSAQPYGYGSDMANWSNHISKLSWSRDFHQQWTASASANIYWGLPGGQELADYNVEQLGSRRNLPQYDPGETTAWDDESVFVNMGLEYRASNEIKINLAAINIAGWINEDYNKRNSFQRTDTYRQEAASITLGMTWKFR